MRMRKSRIGCLAGLIIALAGVLTAEAQQSYSLSWQPNPESDVVSYKIYVGTASSQYNRVYSTGNSSLSIANLPAATYFFAVTAVNTAGLESPFSEEVSSVDHPSGPFLTETLSSSAVSLQVRTLPGATVMFEASTDLQNWTFHENRVANSQGVATLSQPRNSLLPLRFFRVRTL
jgi:hypothetical protein